MQCLVEMKKDLTKIGRHQKGANATGCKQHCYGNIFVSTGAYFTQSEAPSKLVQLYSGGAGFESLFRHPLPVGL
jgi:hypothetical protein